MNRLIAVKPAPVAFKSAVGQPSFRVQAPVLKPAPAPTAAQTNAAAKAQAKADAAAAKQAKLIAAGQGALAAITKPETFTASGALDFGVRTLRGLGLIPPGDPTLGGTTLPPGGVTPASGPADATAGGSGLSSNLIPLALVGLAIWLFLKK